MLIFNILGLFHNFVGAKVHIFGINGIGSKFFCSSVYHKNTIEGNLENKSDLHPALDGCGWSAWFYSVSF